MSSPAALAASPDTGSSASDPPPPAPPTDSPFSWPDAPAVCQLSEAAGPLPLSNWVIPGRLCVGGYPSALSVETAREYAETLASHRLDTFLCLMQSRELERFRPYAGLVEFCLRRQTPSVEDAEFLSFPIPDGMIPKNEDAFLALIADLIRRLRKGRRIYVHCWGGHGRTGTVLCVLLAALYPRMNAADCLILCQSLHSTRAYNPNHRSPEEKGQAAFVERMITKLHELQQLGASYKPPQGFEVAKLDYQPHVEPTAASSSSPVSPPDSPPRAGGGSGVIVVDPFGTASTTQALSAVPSTPLRSPATERRLSAERLDLTEPAAPAAAAGAPGVSEAGTLLRRFMIPVEDSCDMDLVSTSLATSGTSASPSLPPPFTLLSMNTLADKLCTEDSFPHTTPSVLGWQARRSMLLDELAGVGRRNVDGEVAPPPAILCMQEVDHFADWFAPQLRQRGWDQSFFLPKRGGTGDGVAICVRRDAFRVLRVHRVRLGVEGAKSQVGLMLQLLPVSASGANGTNAEGGEDEEADESTNLDDGSAARAASSPRPLRRLLYVATTHLKAKDGFDLVRLRQGQLLTQHLQHFIARFHHAPLPPASEPPIGADQSADDAYANPPHASLRFTLPRGAAVVLAGDFNDTPDSAVYRFMAEGSFPAGAETRGAERPAEAAQAPEPASSPNTARAVAMVDALVDGFTTADGSTPPEPVAAPKPTSALSLLSPRALLHRLSNLASSSSSSSPPILPLPSAPLTHCLWFHSLYNRLWRAGPPASASSSSAHLLNHAGPLYTTSKRRSVLVHRCIDYVFFTPASLRPVCLLSIPPQAECLPHFLPAAHYPSDHLAIAGRFEWKQHEAE